MPLFGEKNRSRTWDEAATRWMREKTKSTLHQDAQKFNWLAPYLGGKLLSDIDGDLIAEIGARKVDEFSSSTANRYLALIRAVLNRACKVWQWLDRCPNVALYPERKHRIRWLTHEEADRLARELPEHLRDMMLLTLATGLRQANVIKLAWNQIDLSRGYLWIHADEAKGREPIRVPLSETARKVLRRQLGKHMERVFTYKGRPVTKVNTKAWKKAMARAGIKGFCWHGLRHTWASWHAQNGTPFNVLQELGGWKTEAMVKRYAHLAPSHYAHYAEAISSMLPAIPSF